ncbi:glycosyltransferase [Synechococcales cyanobacterium C]|uniref:4,4'-diaponeurosporenoate glycosyltransferase n=1 Tax=Petrachloros mirabilis ULC683 TaxID=2781853 RepID=A0A8K2AGY7_9CYAN|nr:glycosyltransferase family 2 protein [Petrachloros mirabilis]NCJ05639.1 glycosyltransferase [Petrachloros mirabilis ULC683]
MSANPALSIIIPASNEAGWIDACLKAVAASQGAAGEVVVVANGCTDDTAARARTHATSLAAAGFTLSVLETPAQGKPGALNTGDAAARYGVRVYLDADVTVSPLLMAQIAGALAVSTPCLAGGTPQVAPAHSTVTQAYARFWSQLPFVVQGCPAFGLYAVNAAGRKRWGEFPAIISDDTFVRLSFAPSERLRLPATYVWPMVEGFAALVRVRRRQDQGVAEVAQLFPHLPTNDDKIRPDTGWLLRQLVADPAAFLTYAVVTLAVRVGWRTQSGWGRGR